MKTKPALRLLAGLVLLTAADCRDTPTGTDPADLSATADLGSSDDLSGSTEDLAGADLAGGGPDLASATDPTELMVVRLGDGAAVLTSSAAAVFVERRKIADGSLVGAPIALPTAVNGTTRRLTLSGTALSEGALTRSVNGRFVLLGGYDTNVGTAGVTTSSSATINRVVGRIAADNSVSTTTAFDALGGGSIRGVASTDGQVLWAGGASGVAYTMLGSTAAPTMISTTANVRVLDIFRSQLYVTSGSNNVTGVNTLGTGTPTAAGAMLTLLPGFAAQNNLSPYGFIAFDRDATPGIDTLYVADDRANGGGVQRWRLVGATWTLDGSFSAGTGFGARSVTGYVSGSNVVLLAVIPELVAQNARVVSFVDTGQNPSTATAKVLATAANNTVYRGISLAPQ